MQKLDGIIKIALPHMENKQVTDDFEYCKIKALTKIWQSTEYWPCNVDNYNSALNLKKVYKT